MQQRPGESDRSSFRHVVAQHLRSHYVSFHVYVTPRQGPIMSQFSPVDTLMLYIYNAGPIHHILLLSSKP